MANYNLTNLPRLEPVRGKRDLVLHVELGALLHDVGKLLSIPIADHPKQTFPVEIVRGEIGDEFADKLLSARPALQETGCSPFSPLIGALEKRRLHKKKHPSTADASDVSWKDTQCLAAWAQDHHSEDLLDIPSLVLLISARWSCADGLASAGDKLSVAPGCDNEEIKRVRLHEVQGEMINGFGYRVHAESLCVLKKKGCELLNEVDLEKALQHDPIAFETIRNALSYALGETREPANDVTLWDHSWAVAVMTKCLLAQVLVERGINPQQAFPVRSGLKKDLKSDADNGLIIPDEKKQFYEEFNSLNPTRFCMVAIAANTEYLYRKGIRIGDLLGYRDGVKTAFDLIEKMTTGEFPGYPPLGGEIYRDAHCQVLLLPYFNDRTINLEFQEAFRRSVDIVVGEGRNIPLEIRFEFEFVDTPKVDQESQTLASIALQTVADARRNAVERAKNPHSNVIPKTQDDPSPDDVCPVCRLNRKKPALKSCKVCSSRRAKRAETWEKNLKSTIWIGEVKDVKSCVALVSGSFDLYPWLSGDFIDKSFRIHANNGEFRFPVSPGRIYRVWNDLREFWQRVLWELTGVKDDVRGVDVERPIPLLEPKKRFKLVPENEADIDNYERMAMEGTLNGLPVSVYAHRHKKAFYTIGAEDLSNEPKTATLTILSSDERKTGLNTPPIKVEISPDTEEYIPLIRLLTENPFEFEILIPGNWVHRVVDRIYERYEEEFALVRDRMPLDLGVVFFKHKTPLYAVMDASRRIHSGLSRRSSKDSIWTLKAKSDTGDFVWNPDDSDKTTGFIDRKWHGCNTEDKSRANARMPGNSAGPTLKAYGKLAEGDGILVRAGKFQFINLDVTVRRYELDLGEHEHRGRADFSGRPPYDMDMWSEWRRIVDILQATPTSQVKQVDQAIIELRESWGESWQSESCIVRSQIEQMIVNSEIYGEKTEKDLDLLVNAGISGLLHDVVQWLSLACPTEDRMSESGEPSILYAGQTEE